PARLRADSGTFEDIFGRVGPCLRALRAQQGVDVRATWQPNQPAPSRRHYRNFRPSASHTSTGPRLSARTLASIFDRSPTITQLIASGRSISSAALVIAAGVSAPYFAGSVAR